MPANSLERLIADFNAFKSTGDEYEDLDLLDALFARLKKVPKAKRIGAVTAIFGVLERHPENSEFGVPGPIVNNLEDIKGHEDELICSVQRMPSYYSLWMINRQLNARLSPKKRKALLQLLESVAKNRKVAKILRDEAKGYLRFQEENS